jgi:protein TonB
MITGWVLWDAPDPFREVPEFSVDLAAPPLIPEEDEEPTIVEPPLDPDPEMIPVVEVMPALLPEPEELPPPVDYITDEPWKPRHLRFRNNTPPSQPKTPTPVEVDPVVETPVTPPQQPAPPKPPVQEPQATVVMAPHIDDAQCPPPDFPRRAQRNRWYGLTELLVDVDALGNPTKVVVRTSSGFDILDNAAIAAVEQWHFYPATRNGVAEAGQLRVPIRFSPPK